MIFNLNVYGSVVRIDKIVLPHYDKLLYLVLRFCFVASTGYLGFCFISLV